jgi:hypothetical protein
MARRSTLLGVLTGFQTFPLVTKSWKSFRLAGFDLSGLEQGKAPPLSVMDRPGIGRKMKEHQERIAIL